MGKNVKHESCRIRFFLGGITVSFLKWDSNGLRFHEKPRLVRSDPVHTISQFQRKTDMKLSRIRFSSKHESFRIFRELELLWRKLFQIHFGFLSTICLIKTVQWTRISCTEFSRPNNRKTVFHTKNTVLNPKTVPKAVFDP